MIGRRSKLNEWIKLGLSLLALAAGFALSGAAPSNMADAGETEAIEAEPPIVYVTGDLRPVTPTAPSDCTS